MEYQIVFPLKTGKYFLALMALGGTSVYHYHLKCLCHCLNIVLYQNDQMLQDRLTQVWEKQKKIDYFFATKKRPQYFLDGTTLF